MRRTIKAIVFVGLAALASDIMAAAAVQGTLYTKDGGQKSGSIRWSARNKSYVITQSQANGSTMDMEVEAKNVDRLEITPPQGMAQAIKAVESGNGAGQVKFLEKVVEDYAHLQWDQTAGSYLAKAYLDANNAAKALDTCKKIIAVDKAAGYSGDLAPTYWQALIKNNQSSTLDQMLAKAASSGDRFASGSALIARGDSIIAKDDTPAGAKKALVDGYLRVVLLYNDEEVGSRIRPEALYKAAQCFEKLGQTARASDHRNELKSRYAASPWAAK
jgi:TolA-binding protein